jgi:tetratricopeptide (TPR) repeat protein
MLDGELQYRRGNYEKAFESLRLAIRRDDGLVYSEPWAWMLPALHPYGALLLEQGRIEEAAEVYAQDLGLEEGQDSAHQHPNNVWGVHGYHECLVRLGRTKEADIISQQLKKAMAVADVPVVSSYFCRLERATQCCNSS